MTVHGGDAAEEELADVGDGHGVATMDAFTRELADEVAEEEVDRFWRGEVFQVAEEFGGGFIEVALFAVLGLASVVGAQFQIGNCGEETAVAAEPVDVTAAGESVLVGGSCCRY